MLAVVPFQHDTADAVAMQDLREQKSSWPSADDSYLALVLPPWAPGPRCRRLYSGYLNARADLSSSIGRAWLMRRP